MRKAILPALLGMAGLFSAACALPSAFAAVAVAATDNSKTSSFEIFQIWDAKSVKLAQAAVMADCKEDAKAKGYADSCRIVFSAPGPGYLAVVHSEDGKGAGAGLGQDEDAAFTQAYADCTRNGAACNGSASIVRRDVLGELVQPPPRKEISPAAAAALGAQYPLPSSAPHTKKSEARAKPQ